MTGGGPNMGALLSSMQTPTSGQPSCVLGISMLKDIQLAPVFPLKAFNIDGMIFGNAGKKPPGFFAKILAEAGFTTANLHEGLSKVAQAGAVQQASHDQIFGHGLGRPGGGGFTELS